MNNQSPLVPLGSMLEQKNKGRARVKIAVSFVLIIHGIGLLALLVQGCHKDDTTTQQHAEQPANNTAALPTLDTSNTNLTTDTTQPPANTTPGEAAKASTDATPQVPASGGTEYTIAKGDTYGSIATHFHVTVKALGEANLGVDEKRLQIGKKIHIPPQPLPASTPGATTAGTPENTSGEKVYTVKSGDMLITIAKANGTTVKAIKSANNLATDSIKVGQKLKIPAKAVETVASNAPAAR